MSETTGTGVEQGWYEDPETPSQLRWWTGESWSEHVSPLPGESQQFAPVEPPPVLATPAPSARYTDKDADRQFYDAPMSGASGPVPYQTGALRSNWAYVPTSGNTFAVWMLAISPFVALGAIYLLGVRVAFIPIAWVVAFALLDIRSLRRMEHEQTAHWAWMLLGPIGYLIARTVVMRRYVGFGSAPLWVFIANTLVASLGALLWLGSLAVEIARLD